VDPRCFWRSSRSRCNVEVVSDAQVTGQEPISNFMFICIAWHISKTIYIPKIGIYLMLGDIEYVSIVVIYCPLCDV